VGLALHLTVFDSTPLKHLKTPTPENSLTKDHLPIKAKVSFPNNGHYRGNLQ